MPALRKSVVAENMFRATITSLSDLEAMFANMPQEFSGGELPEELMAALQAQMAMQSQAGNITVDGEFAEDQANFGAVPPQPVVLQPAVRLTPKVGANEPCPCGSGKKYKKCCGK